VQQPEQALVKHQRGSKTGDERFQVDHVRLSLALVARREFLDLHGIAELENLLRVPAVCRSQEATPG